MLLLLAVAVPRWSVGTFDIHGIHPSSSSAEGTFGDPVIQKMIREANAKVNGNIASPQRMYYPPMPTPSPAQQPAPAPTPASTPTPTPTPAATPTRFGPSRTPVPAPQPQPQPQPAAFDPFGFFRPRAAAPAAAPAGNQFLGPFQFFPFFGRRL